MRNGIMVFGAGFICGIALLVGLYLIVYPGLTRAKVEEQYMQNVSKFCARMDRLAEQAEKEFKVAQVDSQEAALTSNLQTMRAQLELYLVQHLDQYPSGSRFADQLTHRTDANGKTGDSERDFPFGPYLHQIPSNSYIADRAKANLIRCGKGPSPSDGSSGWYFDTSSGKLSANDPAHKDL